MDPVLYKSLLYDYYGNLLTDKQRRIYELYNHEDMSLAEISDLTNVSPQGISDMLKRTEKLLLNYEVKIGVIKDRQSISAQLDNVKSLLINFNKNDKSSIENIVSLIDDMSKSL